MALTLTALRSGRSGPTTSHTCPGGTVTFASGKWGYVAILAGDLSTQADITDVQIGGSSLTKKGGIQDASDYSDRSIWVWDATGGSKTGSITATTANSAEAVFSVFEVSGQHATTPFGAVHTAEGYRNAYDEQTLTPDEGSGIVVGIGGSSWMGVTTTLDGTTIHNQYTYAKPYSGTHYKTYSGSASTSLKWDWNDAALLQHWGVVMLEVVETLKTFTPRLILD